MRLPPLNALRAFEAAARHEGFIGASEELHVTRGAVSRHIKLLEAHLGTPLFRRQANGVQLTEAGRKLLPVLTEAFGSITREADRITSDASDLRIICPPATSIRWLIPRLEAFRTRHPEIRVRLTTDFHDEIGFDASEHDLGFSVEYWPNRSSNIDVLPLFPVILSPACSPALMSGAHRLDVPADLSNFSLLHETPDHDDWNAWLHFFDVRGVDPASGHDFPNLDIATRAAVIGTGVVMADMVLCREELEAGLLVTPFPAMRCESPLGGVSLLGDRNRWHEPKIAAFRAWIEEVVAAEDERQRLVATDLAAGSIDAPGSNR